MHSSFFGSNATAMQRLQWQQQQHPSGFLGTTGPVLSTNSSISPVEMSLSCKPEPPEQWDEGIVQKNMVLSMDHRSNAGSASADGSVSSGSRDELDPAAAVNGAGGSVGQVSRRTPGTVAAKPPPIKKKRNLPGNPDPDAEVIALSPRTLLATNRFICEICNKGFQRDQNLQLHRRGHNLPWKLRQRSSKEVVRKRVYICPEPSCVHHDPARALGDLTGIKKHFCRKHGERKWKCEKCSKRYAVQSDWKAHMKTCGTREYRCDCGTLFSRRDSFITHRAFCDALAQENSRISATRQQMIGADHGIISGMTAENSAFFRPSPLSNFDNSSLAQLEADPINLAHNSRWHGASPKLSLWVENGPGPPHFSSDGMQHQLLTDRNSLRSLAGSKEFSLTGSNAAKISRLSPNPSFSSSFLGQAAEFGTAARPAARTESYAQKQVQAHATANAHTSATALLQKAAMMGATASTPFFRNMGSAGILASDQNCVSFSHYNMQQHESNNTAAGLSSFANSGVQYNAPANQAFAEDKLTMSPSLPFATSNASMFSENHRLMLVSLDNMDKSTNGHNQLLQTHSTRSLYQNLGNRSTTTWQDRTVKLPTLDFLGVGGAFSETDMVGTVTAGGNIPRLEFLSAANHAKASLLPQEADFADDSAESPS